MYLELTILYFQVFNHVQPLLCEDTKNCCKSSRPDFLHLLAQSHVRYVCILWLLHAQVWPLLLKPVNCLNCTVWQWQFIDLLSLDVNGTARDCSCVFHSATLDNSTAQDMAVRITRTTYRQTPGPYRKSSTSHCLILPLLNSFLGRFQFSTKDSDDSVTLSRDIFWILPPGYAYPDGSVSLKTKLCCPQEA